MTRIVATITEPFYISDDPNPCPELVKLVTVNKCVEVHHSEKVSSYHVFLYPQRRESIQARTLAELKAKISRARQMTDEKGLLDLSRLRFPVTLTANGLTDADGRELTRETMPKMIPQHMTKAQQYGARRIEEVWARWPEFAEAITLREDGSAVMHRDYAGDLKLTPFRQVTMYLKGGPRYKAMTAQCRKTPDTTSYDWD